MKEAGQAPTHPLSRKALLSRATAAVVLLSVGYTLGFLSASSSHPTPTPPSPQLLLQFPSQPIIKSTTTTNNPSPPPPDLLRFRTNCSPPVPSPLVRQTLLANIYNGTDPYDGFPAPYTAAHLLPPAPRPRGWGSTGAVFADLIAAVRPTTIIELGTFLGASALHMASLAPDALILCIDDFRGWPGVRAKFRRDLPPPLHGDALLLHQFMLGAKAAGVEGQLLPLPFSTASALDALCGWGVYGDLVEVDAGHDFHSAWADINRAWAVVRPGSGVLFGHDYHTVADNRGVRRAVTLFAKVNGLTVRAHGEHWVLSPKPRVDGRRPNDR